VILFISVMALLLAATIHHIMLAIQASNFKIPEVRSTSTIPIWQHQAGKAILHGLIGD
jgi:hypothetical protein